MMLHIAPDTVAAAPQPTESLRAFVRQQLLEQLARQWAVGVRVPPIRDLADQFGVSFGTAKGAIRDLVDAGVLITRRRVGTTIAPGCTEARVRALLLEGEFDRRQTSSHQADLAGKTISLIYHRELDDDHLFVDLMDRFELAMEARGCQSRRSAYESWPQRVESPDSDAVVVVQPPKVLEPRLERNQILLAISTTRVDVNAPGRFDLVTVDEEHGSFLAGRRLRETGVESACFVGVGEGPGHARQFNATSERRLRGLERGWGAPIPRANQVMCQSYDVCSGEAVAHVYASMSPRPQAVFAASDELALGLIQALRRKGLEPVRDYGIIGFDKRELGRNLPGGPLTTIEVPRVEMADRAAQSLAERFHEIDQPIRRLFLGCSLFEGCTVASQRPHP